MLAKTTIPTPMLPQPWTRRVVADRPHGSWSARRGRTRLALLFLCAVLGSIAVGVARAMPCEAPTCPSNGTVTIALSGSPDLFDKLGAAAEDGDVDAMNVLGVLFVTNARVPSDYSMALYWFQRAVTEGSPDGMYNLATMYLRGLGVPRDYPNAYGWFRRAAEAGNAFGMYSSAAMAQYGLGCTRDVAFARTMYRKAAESGVPLAMLWLSEDLARPGTHHDPIEAYAWLEIMTLAQIDAQLNVVLLARMEELGSALGAEKRDQARAKAAHIVADMRIRAAREAARRPTSPASQRTLPSV